MNFTEKEQQAQNFITTLNGIVLKIDQNETDVANNTSMTTAPHSLRSELLLLHGEISKFATEQLPSLTPDEFKKLPTTDTGREYKIGTVVISGTKAAPLNILRHNIEQAFKSTVDRFNQHVVNLRPMYYPQIPDTINL